MNVVEVYEWKMMRERCDAKDRKNTQNNVRCYSVNKLKYFYPKCGYIHVKNKIEMEIIVETPSLSLFLSSRQLFLFSFFFSPFSIHYGMGFYL